MNDALNELLLSWHDFYFMIGGAAAALLGLMFIGISLAMSSISDDIRENREAFVTPAFSILYPHS